MKKLVKSFALGVIEKHDFNGNHIHKEDIIVVNEVINPEENKENWIYQGTWKGMIVEIPSKKCTPIQYDAEKKKNDKWFDKVVDEYIEPPSPIMKELELKLIHDGTLKKSIKFTIEGIENITPDDVIKQKEKLDEFFDKKETNSKDEGNYDYWGGSCAPKVHFNSTAIVLIFDENSYSEVRSTYWRWSLKCFNVKEPEKPKLKKCERGSVVRYGVCRFPDYFDMLYVETDALREVIEDLYDGDPKKLVKKLVKEGYKAELINIDYILTDQEIIKTN